MPTLVEGPAGATASQAAMANETTDPPDDSASGPRAVDTKLVRPKLRRIERAERTLGGERVIILRDPMGVAESFALDAEFAPVLDLLDGSRTVLQIRQSLRMRGVLDLPVDALADFVADLRDEGWLEDDVFRTRWAALHADFLAEDPRVPRHAGLLYPAEPDQLTAHYGEVLGDRERTRADSDVVGVLVPHGPLELVGPTLDATLVDLPRAEDLDTIVILGTDHGPGLLPFAVANRGFDTPLGPVAADTALLAALGRRVEWAYREEVRHRAAHSIELATVTLRMIYGDAVPPVVAVLCGANVLRARDPDAGDRFVAALEALLDGRRALLWGSAELSHGGTAYGRPALDTAGLTALEDRDRGCLDDLLKGRLDALTRKCKEDHPQGRPSGGAVMRTLRQLVPDARAELAAYRATPLPDTATKDEPGDTRTMSVAGLAGVRFIAPPR